MTLVYKENRATQVILDHRVRLVFREYRVNGGYKVLRVLQEHKGCEV